MKKWTTIPILLVLLLAIPAASLAQGFYGWTISSSATNPFSNSVANPGAGFQSLFLWMLDASCSPTVGWSAAEFKIVTQNSTWQAFSGATGFLEAGPSADATGKNLLLASTGCPDAQQVVGTIFITFNGSPVRVGFTNSDVGPSLGNWAATVDCSSPIPSAHTWASSVRFVGYKTTDDAGAAQDHGADCTTTSLDATAWGSIKSLYR